MAYIMVLNADGGNASPFACILRTAGYTVLERPPGSAAWESLTREPVDVVVTDPSPPLLAIDLLRSPQRPRETRVIVITTAATLKDAVLAMRLGAIDVLEQPVAAVDLIDAVRRALTGHPDAEAQSGALERCRVAHAAERWARAVVPIVECPKDPRTIHGWARWISASPGALRNWCSTAGVRPRRSLLFGRMLRAVALSEGGRHSLENLLDVVDRRTLAGLLRLSGLRGDEPFPRRIDEFLQRQRLVDDAAALSEIRRAIDERQYHLRRPIRLDRQG